MAEYGSMFAVSGIASLLFLGGWHTGVLPADLTEFLGGIFGNVFNVVVFIAKCWTLVFVMMWVRWTLPRLRIDQVMMTCLKYLLPISCVLLVGVSLWGLFIVPTDIQAYFPRILFVACVILVLLLIKQLITWASAPPGTGMPGMWSMVGETGYQGAKRN